MSEVGDQRLANNAAVGVVARPPQAALTSLATLDFGPWTLDLGLYFDGKVMNEPEVGTFKSIRRRFDGSGLP